MIDDRAFNELFHPLLIPRTAFKTVGGAVNIIFKNALGLPLQSLLFRLWLHDSPAASAIERSGLPRYAVESKYKKFLTLDVPPESLNRMAVFPSGRVRRSMANRFIWDGDWDRGGLSFKSIDRFVLMTDIWSNKADLRNSRRYAELADMIKRGRPYTEFNRNRMGIYLNTESKVLRYLEIYLEFMTQLQAHGYDSSLEKDPVCAAIDREGGLIKTSKGLHRLAMAQVLGMKSIPVRIRGVHREWWSKTAGNETDRNMKIIRSTEHLFSASQVF